VLVPTPAVRNLIREAKTHQIYSVLQTGASHGMQTMDAALAQLVRAGKINRQLAESRAHAPEELCRPLSGMGAFGGGRIAMATYVLKAMDLAGVQAKGEVEADSRQAVAEQLKERGLVVVDIAHKYRSKEINLELFARVNAKDLAVASRQLATMVTCGMSIMRALHVLETQTGSKLLRVTIGRSATTSKPACSCRTRWRAIPRCSVRCTSRWYARGDRRCARGVPVARGRPAREGCCAPAPGAGRDGVPGDGDPVRVTVLPALTQFMVNLSHIVTHQWYILIVAVGAIAGGFISVKRSQRGRDH
jgi:type II secretory pathway component PulF